MKTIITTDSGCNPRSIDNMLPCVITCEDGTDYYDTVKVSNNKMKVIFSEQVFERAANGEKIKTANPIVADYMTVFGKIVDEGNEVIHLSMSNGISAGSYNASKLAESFINEQCETPKVTVINTLTAGSGGEVINDYANNLVKQGLSTKEIVEELEEVKKRILSTYYIAKVEGFARSGRAPKGVKLSDMLSLRYRVDISDKGNLFPKFIYRGNIGKEFMKYLKHIINEKNIEEYDPNYLSILITKLEGINIEEAKDYIKSFNYFDEKLVRESNFYGTISAYGVMDQVGFGLIKKK